MSPVKMTVDSKYSQISIGLIYLLRLEPVIKMSPVKMTVGSKYSQISLGLIEKLLFLPCYSNRRQNFKNLKGILKFCYSIWHHLSLS